VQRQGPRADRSLPKNNAGGDSSRGPTKKNITSGQGSLFRAVGGGWGWFSTWGSERVQRASHLRVLADLAEEDDPCAKPANNPMRREKKAQRLGPIVASPYQGVKTGALGPMFKKPPKAARAHSRHPRVRGAKTLANLRLAHPNGHPNRAPSILTADDTLFGGKTFPNLRRMRKKAFFGERFSGGLKTIFQPPAHSAHKARGKLLALVKL